ncbi:twist-related protein [Teleopsis dalmanni]|uniref:twist-related protein n=1 Tax=Teleopsis dalmanni TaxID=139649 RepID=UPI0018CCC51E|nr:twist-related protein [Teleopsis dalmanni]
MPRKKRSSSPFDIFDDDFDEDTSSQSSKCGNPPVQRNAANARERARMRVLSSAFGRLKTKLPNIPPDTKLSKLDTLRLATIYIKQLKAAVEGDSSHGENFSSGIIGEHNSIFNMSNSSQNMSWPFGLHHIPSNSRQMSFQYSTMDWQHGQDINVLPKPMRIEPDNNYTQPRHLNSTSSSTHWYMSDNSISDVCDYSTNCMYENFNQHNSHPRRFQHSHHQPLQLHHPSQAHNITSQASAPTALL